MKKQTGKRGMTLVELIVSIAIAGIIMTGISSLIMTLFVSNNRNKQLEAIEQNKYRLQTQISESVKWAKTINISPGMLTLTSVDNHGVPVTTIYKLENKFIYKDGQPLTGSDVEITNFDITDNSANPAAGITGLTIDVKLRHKLLTSLTGRLKIVTSQRKMEI